MEVSRLTFRKETKKAMEKELTPSEKGELRWKRLKEFEKDGRLSLIKTRRELAVAAGYPEEEMHKGVAWVFRLINNGHITETLLGFNKQTKTPEYEYHLSSTEPNYRVGRARQTPKANIERKWKRWQDEMKTTQIPQAPQTPQPVFEEVSADFNVYYAVKMEIIRGDITIKLEFIDKDKAVELVKQLLT